MKKLLNSDISWGDAGTLYGLFLSVLSIIMIIFSSCSSSEKALKKAEAKMIASGKMPEFIATNYPPKVYKGDTIIRIDTITQLKDTTFYKILDGDTTFITLPQLVKTVTIVKTIHDTLIDQNALIAAQQQIKDMVNKNSSLANNIVTLSNDNAKIRSERNRYIYICSILCIMSIFGVFFYFKK